jgi:hypothetical protein
MKHEVLLLLEPTTKKVKRKKFEKKKASKALID